MKKDERVVFIHFFGMSVIEMYDMFKISRHQNRFTLRSFPRISRVFDAYMNLISKHNSSHYCMVPYGYKHFSDGTLIESWMREMYAAAVYPTGNTSEQERDENPPNIVNVSPYLRADFDDRAGSAPFCASKGWPSQTKTSTVALFYWLLDTKEDKAVVNSTFHQQKCEFGKSVQICMRYSLTQMVPTLLGIQTDL